MNTLPSVLKILNAQNFKFTYLCVCVCVCVCVGGCEASGLSFSNTITDGGCLKTGAEGDEGLM